MGVQKSRHSEAGEVRFTINFGVTSKALMTFKGDDPLKMPVDGICPIRCRIGQFLKTDDLWWSSDQGDDFRGAFTTIVAAVSEKGMPFLNQLGTDAGILALYQTGVVMGFEIDRDETRLVLLAHSDLKREAAELLMSYAERWLPGATSRRASHFLASYRARFGFVDV